MNSHPGPSIADIALMLADRAVEVCRDFLPHGVREGNRWRCGNVLGDRGQSLSVLLAGPKAGHWRDFSSAEGGDLVDLIAAGRGVNKGEAVRFAKAWLGLSEDTGRPSERRHGDARLKERHERHQRATEDEARKKRQWALDLWRSRKLGGGTVVEAYLRGRGITVAVPPAVCLLRLHEHKPTKRPLPVMLAGVFAPIEDATAPSGVGWELTAVHRTWLEVDGLTRGASAPNFLLEGHVTERFPACAWRARADGRPEVTKLDHPQAKMMLGPAAGGIVPLTPKPLKSTLAITEGIETGLSLAQMNPGWSVWAALTVSNMGNIIIPPAVRRLVLCADGDSKAVTRADGSTVKPADEAVKRAAALHAAIAADAGRSLEVEIGWPPEGQDVNDVLRAGCSYAPGSGADADAGAAA